MKRFVTFLHSQQTLILLFGIFLLALSFRGLYLGEIPNGFHRDEVISGYVGRYILQNGVDIYGKPWPLLYVDKYGDFPPAIPMYLSGIGTYFFGMTIFATRFPVAIVGALLVFPMYFLAASLFKNKYIGLLAAFFTAILPWHIVLSRATAEGVVAVTVAVFALWLLVKSLSKNSYRVFVLSVALFFLTYLLYPSFRILVALILLPIPFLFKGTKLKMRYLIGAFLLAFILTGIIAAAPWGKGRFSQTSIYGSHMTPPLSEKLDHFAKEEGTGNVLLARTFHNKPIIYARETLVQYGRYFTPDYLFLQGGFPERYRIPEQGLLYITFLVFFAFGLYGFVGLKDKKVALFTLYLLLIAPIPSALTFDDAPNVHRSIFMIVPLILIVSFGFSVLVSSIHKKQFRYGVIAILSLCVLLECAYFSHQYFRHSAVYQGRARGEANVETIQFLLAKAPEFKKAIVPVHDAFPIYYLYFSGDVGRQHAGTFGPYLRKNAIGNVSFVDQQCPRLKAEPDYNVLIVEYPECTHGDELKFVEEIHRKDGSIVYRFLKEK